MHHQRSPDNAIKEVISIAPENEIDIIVLKEIYILKTDFFFAL